jgi:hypothetical protein
MIESKFDAIALQDLDAYVLQIIGIGILLF